MSTMLSASRSLFSRSLSQRLVASHSRQIPQFRSFSESKPVVRSAGGSGIFQRISSFLIGAGLSALASQMYIYQELHDSNRVLMKRQLDIEDRLAKLEKK